VFVAMPLLEGGTLQSWLRGAARSLDAILDHFVAAGHGLAAAHAAGLVHRDVKPANVFLRGDGRTTLFDFGLACPANSVKGADLCVGTMEYAAPEQICGASVDHRADIYSLGCLLYELVTGRPPFRGDSSSEIAERQLKRDPIAPSHLIGDMPTRLEDLILSMLSKTPARRPDHAAEVAHRLLEIERRIQPGAITPPLRLLRAG
jgi:serine/threonine-protein kinase